MSGYVDIAGSGTLSVATPASIPPPRPPTPPAPPRKILTASAMKMEPRDSEARRLKQADWQKQAFSYVKTIPELGYASRFYSKYLKRVRLFPALRDANDSLTPITTGPPVDLLDRIQDPGGGRSQIQGSYGRLMFITGEGYLFGRNLRQPGKERWMFVSAAELEMSNNKIIWRPTEGSSGQEFDDGNAVAYRMWSPDPERSGDAESPMKSALEIAEELRILTKAVRATAVSRIIQGILKVPSEISFGSDAPGLDDDPEENPFLADLIDHIVGAIENAGTAEAATPFMAEGAGEFLSYLEWIKMHDPATDYMEKELRKEAVERLSVGLDMPPEILKGMAEANHWGARQIMHDAWRSHGAPVAEQMCDDFSEAYLRPALEEVGYEDWEKVVIAYDDSKVVVSPDRSEDADKAYDRGQIKDEAYLDLKGFDQAMKATEEDKRFHLAIKLREPAFLKGTKYELDEPEPAPGIPGPDPNGNGKLPAEEMPPLPGPAGVSRRESRSLELQGAARLALLRCRELAGSRIRSNLRKTDRRKHENMVHLAQIEGKPNTFVAAILGHEKLAELGLSDALALVKTGTESFVTFCLESGIEEQQALALAQVIETYAAKTLYERRLPQFPAGFDAQLERAIEISLMREEEVVRHNNDSLARLCGLLGGEVIAA